MIKNMRKKIFIYLLLLFACPVFAQNVSLKILKKETTIDQMGFVKLVVEIKNKSKSEITILKPAIKPDQKWRYYDIDIECNDMPIFMGVEVNLVEYSDDDLITISPNSTIKLLVDGRYNANMLSCNSKKFKVELFYDSNELLKDIDEKGLSFTEKELIKKLTPMKMTSKKTKIIIQ